MIESRKPKGARITDDFENKDNYINDIVEFQKHQFDPGYYVGTGRVPPNVSAPGNALPYAIYCFFAALVLFGIGLFLFFSNVNITSGGLIESPLGNKILALVTFGGFALFFLFLGFAYLKKAKRHYKLKRELASEKIDKTVKDELWQRTCPDCGKQHDLDYPKCPHCGHNYLDT